MNGTLTQVSSNAQYKKYKYTYAGKTYSDIHVFTTLTTQSIAPAVSTTKVALSTMNPANVSADKVIAKTNACMFDYNATAFYGFFYQGSGQKLYVNGTAYSSASSIPTNSKMFNDSKFYPSFCVKTDGTATIRWFGSRSDLTTAIPYCSYIIGACHPLVFNSKCVFNEAVYDAETTSKVIYNSSNPDNSGRYNTGIAATDAVRTLLGHKSNKTFVLVCTDSILPMKAAANLMQDLGCDYAVNMDGSTPVQMRIKDGYGANGKVTSQSGHTLNTAVCAYIK